MDEEAQVQREIEDELNELRVNFEQVWGNFFSIARIPLVLSLTGFEKTHHNMFPITRVENSRC